MPKFSKSYSRDLLADNGLLQMRVPRQLEPVLGRYLYIVYSLLIHFWYPKDRIVLKAHLELFLNTYKNTLEEHNIKSKYIYGIATKLCLMEVNQGKRLCARKMVMKQLQSNKI